MIPNFFNDYRAQFQKISDMCQSLKALKLMSQQLQGISYMQRVQKT